MFSKYRMLLNYYPILRKICYARKYTRNYRTRRVGMNKTVIFGHKNPDTDSICSALAYADLKEKLGVSVEPVRLGVVDNETQYALDYFSVEAPRLLDKVDEDGPSVILVDHNEFQQSVDNIAEQEILEVIDHHRIANFETADPLFFRAGP